VSVGLEFIIAFQKSAWRIIHWSSWVQEYDLLRSNTVLFGECSRYWRSRRNYCLLLYLSTKLHDVTYRYTVTEPFSAVLYRISIQCNRHLVTVLLCETLRHFLPLCLLLNNPNDVYFWGLQTKLLCAVDMFTRVINVTGLICFWAQGANKFWGFYQSWGIYTKNMFDTKYDIHFSGFYEKCSPIQCLGLRWPYTDRGSLCPVTFI
jgi:hypothetical protein